MNRVSEPFSVLRCVVAVVTGVLGLALGLWASLVVGNAVDDALSHPLGGGSGFVPIGNLVGVFAVVGTLLGVTLGALGGQWLFGRRGPFWRTLGVVAVALAAVLLLSVWATGLVFSAFLLLPVAAAVSLELGDTSRE